MIRDHPLFSPPPVSLRPQDVAVLLYLTTWENSKSPGADESLTLKEIAAATHLSVSEIHNVLQRATVAGLFRHHERRVNRHALQELIVHGVRYVFPAQRGGIVRGIPTSYAAAPLNTHIVSMEAMQPVWHYAEGESRGIALTPLYPAAPEAARQNKKYHELLALTDALRSDARLRERDIATRLLIEQLNNDTSISL